MYKILYVNKPKGISSFDLCYKLRKVFKTKRIGHTGTLDPNASGVMIVLIDEATKINQFLLADKKTYVARVLYGIETDSLDIMGKVTKRGDYQLIEKEKIQEVLNSFLGFSKQEVPITSAKKIKGKKLYQYQLEEKEVELPIIDIEITKIKLLEMYEDGFSFECEVSSGTYIRSLVRDILKKLNIIGTTLELTRTKIDDIKLENCDELFNIEQGNYHLQDCLSLLKKRYTSYEYDNELDIKNGKRIKIVSEKEKILITSHGNLLAVYIKDNDEYRCLRGLW